MIKGAIISRYLARVYLRNEQNKKGGKHKEKKEKEGYMFKKEKKRKKERKIKVIQK